METTPLQEEQIARGGLPTALIERIENGLELFLDDPGRKDACCGRVRGLACEKAGPEATGTFVVPIESEDDIVVARSKARRVAESIGFSNTEQIKIATAVSELTRNIARYVGKGRMEITELSEPRKGLRVVCEDKGRGIPNLDEIFSGSYRSKSGMGIGILGCRKIMDDFDIQTGPGGTRVVVQKFRL